MIEFDYKIVRDEVDSIVTYIPKIQKKLDNFVSISGPNASGKSTLLNIVAISCYGLKNKTINESLKKRMQALVDSEHQKLSFQVKILDKKEELKLLSTKDPDKSEIMIYENDKRITYDDFSRKYNLIYDIPEKPTERIKDLNTELKERQVRLGNRLSSLSMYIRETINAINASKDPKKIAELKNEREKLKDSLEELGKSKKNKEDELNILENYYYCKYYLDYLKKYNGKKKEKEEILQNKRKNKRKNFKLAKEMREFIKEARELINEIKSDLDYLKQRSKNISKDQTRSVLFYWEKLELKEVLLEKDPNNWLILGLVNLRVIFNNKIEEINSNSDIDKANLLFQLIELLNHYKELNSLIPGIDKTIPEFIQLLENEYENYEGIKKLISYIQDSLILIDSTEKKIENFTSEFADRLIEIEDDFPDYEEDIIEDDEEDYKIILQSLELEEKKYFEKYTEYLKKFQILGIKDQEVKKIIEEIENKYLYLTVYDEGEALSKINMKRKEINENIKNDINNINSRILQYDDIISDLDSKKPHRYQEYLLELNSHFNRVQKLESKILNAYNDYLNELIKGRTSLKNLTNDKIHYYDVVGNYIGKKIKEIPYVEKIFNIDKINLIQEEIITSDGKRIKFTDMSTGQGQASYLKGLLNSSDKRKVIALLDEVAMMDSASLELVYSSLKELEKKDMLLAAVVVKKSDYLEINKIF